MSSADIVLDPRIRDWVLLPIFVVMVLQGVLRQAITEALKDKPSPSRDSILQAALLSRSKTLRANGHFLPPDAFHMRKTYFEKRFRPAVEAAENAQPQMPQMPGQDPNQMMGMMKNNFAMIIPNMLMMGWISTFFSGFVLARLPFGLADRFKSMVQRGISLQSLNVSYVSSLSMYIILMFGLRGLFSILLGRNNAVGDQARLMQQQMGGGANAMQQQQPDKLFAAELNELDICDHDWRTPEAEPSVLLQRHK